MPDERRNPAGHLRVNKLRGLTFHGLSHPGPYGETTMKRIATMLLVAGLMAAPMLALPTPSRAGVRVGIDVSVGIPPPPLPVYVQPVAPGPGYIWTPGYWAWDPAYGYYWIPGTWVLPPVTGLLWTPGWWGWSGGFYRWHAGYWGPRVGFYGGINYGFGYFGVGYVGGYWRGGHFWYNRAVNNVNVTNIRNVYVNKTVINHYNRVTRASYNGGRGGVMARPTAAQLRYANERHPRATPMQMRQRELAMRDPAQRFNVNRGHPAVFATQRPGHFTGPHAIRTPAAAQGSMTASSPERAFVHAPRAHDQPERPADRSFRNDHAIPLHDGRAAAVPDHGRGFTQAPREHPRSMRQAAQPYSDNRTAPVRGPARARPEPAYRHGARGERMPSRESASARHQSPPREGPREKAPHGKHHGS